MQALLKASSVLLNSHDLQVLLPGILDIAQAGLAADAYALWREIGPGQPWRVEASRGLSQQYVQTHVPHRTAAAYMREPMLLDARQAHPMLRDRQDNLRAEGIQAMAVVPIIVQGVASGTLAFYFRHPHLFTDQEIEYARTLANLAGAAIGNAELFARHQETTARAHLLSRVTAIFNSSLEFETTAQAVANAVVPEIADWCALYLCHGQSIQRVAVAHVDPQKLTIAQEMSANYPEQLNPERGALKVMRTLEPELITGITDDMLVAAARSQQHLRLLRGLEIHSFLTVPLVLGSTAIGILRMVSSERRPALNDKDIQLARQIADRAAVALENSRLHREQRETAEQHRMLGAIGQKLAAELDQAKLLQAITDAGTHGTAAQFGAFFYNVDNGAGGSYMLYTLSGVAREHFSNFPMPRNTAVFSPTFRGEGPVRSDDITKDPRYGRNAPHFGMPHGHLPVRSYLAVPVKNQQGTVVGGLLFGHERPGVFTERAQEFIETVASQAAIALTNASLYKRAQDEIARRAQVEQELERQRHFLSLSQKVASVGSWELDLRSDPPRVTWGPELEVMYGIAPGAFSGLYQQWIDSLHPDDRQTAPASITRAILDRTPWEHEFRILRPDGTLRWMAGRGQCFYDADQPVSMIGLNIDITARKQAEEALRKSEKLSAAGRLAATIAHEINNPLEAVTNLLYLARADADPQTAHLLEAADQELRRVAHIAKQTLGFYRESSAPTTFDAADTVRQVMSILSRHIENRRIHPHLHARQVTIKATEGEIRQVISNLVVNAVDASTPDSPLRVRVGPAAMRRNGRVRPAVRITVADYGHGISRDTLQHIGEPFFTTKKDVGTGLGLWVSRGIVEKHSGRMQIRSRLGRGTVFSILLPRHSAETIA